MRYKLRGKKVKKTVSFPSLCLATAKKLRPIFSHSRFLSLQIYLLSAKVSNLTYSNINKCKYNANPRCIVIISDY